MKIARTVGRDVTSHRGVTDGWTVSINTVPFPSAMHFTRTNMKPRLYYSQMSFRAPNFSYLSDIQIYRSADTGI